MKIENCDGAEESLEEILKKIPNSGVRQQRKSWLKKAFERYVSGERMAKGTVEDEGKLPNGKKFLAMKRIPIRAYFWVSDSIPSTIFISHYIYKKNKKLHSADSNKVCRNWKKYERGVK